ncbi:MAG: type II CAAX endopeptidase family protein [Clostridiaceae bacterium]|nr:type II CAAX endopeptidase family protein [Clostridiaceae bacterium]
MNKDKLTLVSGFMPALVLMILLGFQYAARGGYVTVDLSLYGMTMAAAFVFPFIVVLLVSKASEGVVYRFKGFSLRFLPFVLFMSVALSLISFLLNWLVAEVFSIEYTVQSSVVSGNYPMWQLVLISIFLPALLEEFFFRGALLSALEGSSFFSALVVTALSFALVHGDTMNIAGPLLAGLIYGYMTYITGSVWSAVLAHFINNSLTFGIGYFLERYSAIGIWQYFLIVVLVLFFVFIYWSMGSLEKLIEKGKVSRIKRSGISKATASAVFSPGLWLLVIVFLLKSFYL